MKLQIKIILQLLIIEQRSSEQWKS